MRVSKRMLPMLALSLVAGNASAQDATSAATATPAVPLATPAATPPPTAAPERAKSRFVEEIVVTAQKREENLQDIPISVQAFSADLLDARGITDQKELQLITPGLDIGTQVSYTTIFLRGVGTDAFLTADPSVAMYIDGIYFPFAQGLSQEFGAVERIEVLKGPQGTLFGRNTNGGAISIVTEKPQFDAQTSSAQLSLANYPDLQTRIHTNIPVGDSFAFSVSALYNRSEYYVTGTADGKPLHDDVARGARMRVRWQPTEDLDMTLSAFKLRVDGAGSNFTINRDPSPLGRLLLMQPQDQYQGDVDSATFNTVDNTVYYGELTYAAGPFDLKLLGSDQFIDTAGIYDFDGTVVPVASFLPPKNYADVQTGELQLISNADSWGASWLKWIVGGYYFRGESGFDPIIGTIAGLDLSGYSSSLIGLPPGFVDELNMLVPDLASAIPSGQLYLVGTVNTESSAMFVQTTISLSDWFDVTLGGRYQSERREIARSATDLRGLNGSDIEVIEYDYAIDQEGNRVAPRDTTKKFSPKISLEFRPFENDTLIYTSYQKATKSATYNTTAITGAPTYVGPETLTAFEAGIKSSAFDGLMRYAIAAFYYDIDNLQVQFFSLFNGGIVSFENAKAARSRGLEFDTTIELLPSVFDGLVLAAGGAYVDSQYTDFDDCSGYGETTGLFNRNLDCTGKNIVRSPKYTGTLSLSKTWEIPGGSLELTGEGYHNDGFFYEANNNPRTEQKSYQVVGVRTSYLYERWNLRTTLFVKNLFDEFYSQGALPNDFGDGINVAPPRTYGVRVNWDF